MERLPHCFINSSAMSSECYSEKQTMVENAQHESCVTESNMVAVKKRKRQRSTATAKKAEDVECQRLNHIAVERNRRRQMNEHLAKLREMMPASLVRRGDQASIVGGAIEFIKDLEHHLLALQSQKRHQTLTATASSSSSPDNATAQFTPSATESHFSAPQCMIYSCSQLQQRKVDVEVTMVQEHASVKVAAPRVAGLLVRAVTAVEEMRMTVVHLNATAIDQGSMLYAMNLKMEEDCQLKSADEIATAVHQIFTVINGCCA